MTGGGTKKRVDDVRQNATRVEQSEGFRFVWQILFYRFGPARKVK